MTIRKKIFLLAGILLALFGVVVGVLAVIQKLNSDEINNIAEYELPLTRLVAEIDVDTDRYELGILRALRLDPLNPPELAAAVSAKQEMTDELRADVDAATALLAKAIQDPSYRTAERVELARIEGAFKYLSRSLEGFLATGTLTMSALSMADARMPGQPRLASPSLRKHSDRTYPRFAATFPIFRIVLPVLFSQDNCLTLT
jgi:adenylate cyclase